MYVPYAYVTLGLSCTDKQAFKHDDPIMFGEVSIWTQWECSDPIVFGEVSVWTQWVCSDNFALIETLLYYVLDKNIICP